LLFGAFFFGDSFGLVFFLGSADFFFVLADDDSVFLRFLGDDGLLVLSPSSSSVDFIDALLSYSRSSSSSSSPKNIRLEKCINNIFYTVKIFIFFFIITFVLKNKNI
jgi:hypothetical protein